MCVHGQIFIQPRLSQWVLTECSTSSKIRWHWSVMETLLVGGWWSSVNMTLWVSVPTGEQWLDPHATPIRHSTLMECTGVSLKRDSSAMQSTSPDSVSLNHIFFLHLNHFNTTLVLEFKVERDHSFASTYHYDVNIDIALIMIERYKKYRRWINVRSGSAQVCLIWKALSNSHHCTSICSTCSWSLTKTSRSLIFLQTVK